MSSLRGVRARVSVCVYNARVSLTLALRLPRAASVDIDAGFSVESVTPATTDLPDVCELGFPCFSLPKSGRMMDSEAVCCGSDSPNLV